MNDIHSSLSDACAKEVLLRRRHCDRAFPWKQHQYRWSYDFRIVSLEEYFYKRFRHATAHQVNRLRAC